MTVFLLRPADGPPCPICGCRDSKILREPAPGSWWEEGRALCGHCGAQFTYKQPEAAKPHDPDGPVIRERVRCPCCNSADVSVRRSKPQKDDQGKKVSEGWIIRYCRCNGCQINFKAVVT